MLRKMTLGILLPLMNEHLSNFHFGKVRYSHYLMHFVIYNSTDESDSSEIVDNTK